MQLQAQFKTFDDYRNEYTLKPIRNKDSVSIRTIRKFGAKSPDRYAGAKKPNKFKGIIGKLSRGLMLPIAMLPIAGLFLGIGSALVTQAANHGIGWLEVFGRILKVPGDAVFSNLALLFCVAIAITFANDKGVAGLAAVVGWLSFCALQSALITDLQYNDAGILTNARILFYHFKEGGSIFTPEIFNAVVTNNIGIQSFQTSVFGGITIGALTAFLYNKYKNIQLPQILGFFSGVRFIPIITFITSLGVSLFFCLIWPLFGLGLYKFGIFAGSLPFGINSLIFGFVERLLVPTGLHHAFYMPLWQTSAGGQMIITDIMQINGVNVLVDGHTITWQQFAGSAYAEVTSVVGDQNCWAFINGLVGKVVTLESGGTVKLTFANVAAAFKGVNPGQYMQGRFPFMIFCLPAAAFGIVMAAPKGNGRKVAMSAVIGSALTSFLTGITEPIDFTFLFLAPVMYFGFHASGAAISFWLMNLLGAHCGQSFSGGIIDLCIYGVLPDIMGGEAKSWLVPLIGLPLSVVYFFFFVGYIKKFDIKTPGRQGSENKLFTKADYKAKAQINAPVGAKLNNAPKLNVQEQLAYDVINAYGGKANITNVDACITKLRVEVVSANNVNIEKLKQLGAKGVMKISPTAVYAVFGTKADIIKNHINELLPKI